MNTLNDFILRVSVYTLNDVQSNVQIQNFVQGGGLQFFHSRRGLAAVGS